VGLDDVRVIAVSTNENLQNESRLPVCLLVRVWPFDGHWLVIPESCAKGQKRGCSEPTERKIWRRGSLV
jgi:hypothetical protein